jgi:putative transposase
MPRAPRLDLPGIPQHVVQRGNNRQPCFFRTADRAKYLETLGEYAAAFGCAVHAYVLMTNHVHLLLTPGSAGAVSRTLQAIGRRYVRWLNNSFERTGTLWEGRYKSCLVESDRYLLACYRYIELNPVRAGLVPDPGDHPWSSYRSNSTGLHDGIVTPHAVYLELGADASARRERYRELVRAGLSEDELSLVRRYTNHQRALGSKDFQREVGAALGRPAGIGKAGRPARPKGAE